MPFAFGIGSLSWQFPALVVVFAGALGAGIFTLTKKTRSQSTLLEKITASVGTLIGIAGLIWGVSLASRHRFQTRSSTHQCGQ